LLKLQGSGSAARRAPDAHGCAKADRPADAPRLQSVERAKTRGVAARHGQEGSGPMRSRTRSIIVIGTSAGGLEALDRLVGELPAGLRAAIFIVQHIATDSSGEPLVRRLSRHKAFRPQLASHGGRFKTGHIYIAPPDHHLLVKSDRMLVTKGATENRQRPGVDPLFRSAAVAHGARVIGVVLTGMLDDGTAGLLASRWCRTRATRRTPACR
jgi:two-component system chemotaxis response regulator CheB